MNSKFHESNKKDKEVTVWVKAHIEDIEMGGMAEIANKLAKKLAQDCYERSYILHNIGNNMFEVAITVIFPAIDTRNGILYKEKKDKNE